MARWSLVSFIVGLAAGLACVTSIGACARAPQTTPVTGAGTGLPPLPPPSTEGSSAAPAVASAPPLPAPMPTAENAPATAPVLSPDVEIGAPPGPGDPGYTGSDPFAAPPSATVALAPPPPRPPGTDPPADRRVYFEREERRIHARLAALVRGMSPAGPPIDTKVDGIDTHVGGLGRVVRTLRIPVSRGSCYGLVARESYDLDLSLNAQAAIDATFYEDGGDWVAVYQQTAAVTEFCPQSAGQLVVRLMLDHRDPLPAVAKGTFRVQLFRRPIADSDLQARARKHEALQRQEALRYVCGHCAKVLLVCRLTGEPGCASMYLGCLQSQGLTPDDCERGDIAPPPSRNEPPPVSL